MNIMLYNYIVRWYSTMTTINTVKKNMHNNKVELSKILPTNLCNTIFDYDVNCNKCNTS